MIHHAWSIPEVRCHSLSGRVQLNPPAVCKTVEVTLVTAPGTVCTGLVSMAPFLREDAKLGLPTLNGNHQPSVTQHGPYAGASLGQKRPSD